LRKSFIKIIVVIFYILLPVICFGQGAQVTDTLKLDYRTKESLDTNLFNVFPKKVNKTKVGLVLSGGGAEVYHS